MHICKNKQIFINKMDSQENISPMMSAQTSEIVLLLIHMYFKLDTTCNVDLLITHMLYRCMSPVAVL